MGLIYQEAGEELADFYFNNNINFINQLDHINVIDVQRVLFASRHTAAYMINQHRIDAAIEFLTKALKLSQKKSNHQTSRSFVLPPCSGTPTKRSRLCRRSRNRVSFCQIP